VDILDIRHQSLSLLLADFFLCQSCGIVDGDENRIKVGSLCSRCGAPSPSAHHYFPLPALSLIDLMQEFYHTPPPGPMNETFPPEQNHKLAVVIFFCTLGEVLLQHFLEEGLYKLRIPYDVQSRLLEDHLFVKQRVDKVFPLVTGNKKWKASVKMLSKRGSMDYTETVAFYETAADKRNLFLHRGNKWAIADEMPEQCMQHIQPLLYLFVDLHNEFIARDVGHNQSDASTKRDKTDERHE
jgi:hypothetical protein